MKHLSLFSGIGGIDLAATWAGFTTAGFVEQDKFCQRVLAHHWPGVPIFDDVRSFPHEPFFGIELLTGGFPCQDISAAGKGAGLDGERSGLWYAMLDAIIRVQPRYVVAENVAALFSRGIDTVLGGLEEAGYTAEAFLVGSDNVGAPHQRKRVFIVAERQHPMEDARHRTRRPIGQAQTRADSGRQRPPSPNAPCDPDVNRRSPIPADADTHRQQQQGGGEPEVGQRAGNGSPILADTASVRRDQRRQAQSPALQGECPERSGADQDPRQTGQLSGRPEGLGSSMADADGNDGQRGSGSLQMGRERRAKESGPAHHPGGNERRAESGMGGGAHGFPRRLDPDTGHTLWPSRPGQPQEDWEAPRLVAARAYPYRAQRLKALGNAVNPEQIYPILLAIAERINRHDH